MLPGAELPRHVDATMISCFRSCDQKFFLEFCLGRRPAAVSIDLHAGGCFALALETIYGAIFLHGASLSEAMLGGFRIFQTAWGDVQPMKDTPKTKENTWAAVEEYFRVYAPATDHVQPYRLADGKPAMEFTFAIPLLPILKDHEAGFAIGHNAHDGKDHFFPCHPSGDPFVYSGRFDMLGNWQSKPVVKDDKTTTSIGALWSNQWDLRSQFIGYTWACQQSGIPVDTVVVRGVGILKTKISMAEAIKTYSNDLVSRWHEQLRRDLWKMRRSWDEGYFDYNFAESCSVYGGCMFKDVCASGSPQRWLDQFPVRRWNPLLKNPVGEVNGQAAA